MTDKKNMTGKNMKGKNMKGKNMKGKNMKGRKNRIRTICLCTALAASVPFTGGYDRSVVYAAGTEEDSGIDIMVTHGSADLGEGTASITIKGNEGQSLTGKRFEIFRLFDAENAKGGESLNYTYHDKYKAALQKVTAAALNQKNGGSLTADQVTEYQVLDYIQSLRTVETEGVNGVQGLEGRYSSFRYFVETLRTEIKEQGLTGKTICVTGTGEENVVEIKGLPYGYYIIDEVSHQDQNGEKYYASSLCMVDTANPSVSLNIKSDYSKVINKIQEDDHKEVIGNNGWNDIGDYEIGQTISYRFESTVSDMNGYDTYYYGWHDQMDEALTFQDEKSRIQILLSNGQEEYVLQQAEFQVITDPSLLDQDDTFLIQVEDMKKIVDREFNRKDSLGHNIYEDLRVTLTYEAVLNDQAAERTGRPGFENAVRLEFSNDPDSDGRGKTGYTPWDTVVCFTFCLESLKTNEAGKVLEGASFRLYSDPECANEVYVKEKQGESGSYIVINRDSVGGDDHTGGTAPASAVEMSSDSAGNFTIFGLDQGTYYLKETNAPDGYRQLLDPIVVTIQPVYTSERNSYTAGDGASERTLQKLEATAHVKDFYEGLYEENDTQLNTTVDHGSADLQVINQTGSRLPAAGSAAMPFLMGIGAFLVCGTFIWNRKKNRLPGKWEPSGAMKGTKRK